MIFLNMMTVSTCLKTISFFYVINDVNDCLVIIKKNNVTKFEKDKYFKDYHINQEVAENLT